MARITSTYDYITKSQRSIIESNIEQKLSVIQDSLLDFEIDFNSFDWAQDEMERIAVELVSMGRYFASQQGLWETGNLVKHIKAETTNNYGIKFYNNAKNSRNQYYAGHHEYGYKGRDGKFIEARPFMRPALYAVSRASQGEFANILGELLSSTFREGGYQGIKNLNFGKELGHFHKGVSSSSLVLSNMMKLSTINPRYFSAEEDFEKRTRNRFSVKRNVFSDKKNELHKKDIGWRSIRGSVRSGRSIKKSTLASVQYKRANTKKSNPKILFRQRLLLDRKISLKDGKGSINEKKMGKIRRHFKKINSKKEEEALNNHFDKVQAEKDSYNKGRSRKSLSRNISKGRKKSSDRILNHPQPNYSSNADLSKMKRELYYERGRSKSSLVEDRVGSTKGYKEKVAKIKQEKAKQEQKTIREQTNMNQRQNNRQKEIPIGAKPIKDLSDYYSIEVITPSGNRNQVEVSKIVFEQDFYYSAEDKAYRYKDYNYNKG